MTRQKGSEVLGRRGFLGWRGWVFKRGNDGKINDFKRIIGSKRGGKKHVSTDTPRIKKTASVFLNSHFDG